MSGKGTAFRRSVIVTGIILALGSLGLAQASASATSTITGLAFQDLNRDGVMQSGETPLTGKYIDLFDGSWNYVKSAATDAAGRYTFTALTDGTYHVDYSNSDWWTIWNDWVPTTTGSIIPRVVVSLSGSATADFGWRPIVRSTNASQPISSFVSPKGLLIRSYDDVVNASDIYDDLMLGGLRGAEEGLTTINFDWGTSGDACVTSTSQSGGVYSNYTAVCSLAYTRWLDSGDAILFHEYGHAWSLYYAYIVQQDPTMSAYLRARGIDPSDSRLGTSHAWSRCEMIAEDFRQLFGSANAQQRPQENTDIPPAAQVAGLREFLSTTYMQAPSQPAPSPTPTPSPAVAISSLSVSPAPVQSSATVSFTLSTAATVTVTIRDSKGNVVRTLLASVAEAGGGVSVGWNRTNAAGKRVRSGTYSVRVDASASTSATASMSFTVS